MVAGIEKQLQEARTYQLLQSKQNLSQHLALR